MDIVEIDGIRYLRHGAASQGAVVINDKSKIVSPFCMLTVNAINSLPRDSRVLMLGGGTFTIPQHIRDDINMLVVEIMPEMESIAIEQFGWEPKENVLTVVADAQEFVSDYDQELDLVIVDLWDGERVPEFAKEKEFYGHMRTNHVMINEFSSDNTAPYFNYGEWDKAYGIMIKSDHYWVTRSLRNVSMAN